MLGVLALPRRWALMRNRNDEITVSPDGRGVRCDWIYTRPLHLCNVFPLAGRWLMLRALKNQPVRFAERPGQVSESLVCCNAGSGDHTPEVSFLIGHRGEERIPLLLATLYSIAAQQGISFECVMVEQDEFPHFQATLPDWVRYLHSPASKPGLPYNRSKAFNDAARIARGQLLVLHDNDLLVPSSYAAEALRIFLQGYDVIQLKRFIFYLTELSTGKICRSMTISRRTVCEQVLENATGGGSIAVSAALYQRLGGMDEDFIGWGGEDEDFWDRCLTRTVWEYGAMPLLHLWHSPQPGKRAVNGQGAYTAELTARRRKMPVEQRIVELTARQGKVAQ